jgi:hypothetical protein
MDEKPANTLESYPNEGAAVRWEHYSFTGAKNG